MTSRLFVLQVATDRIVTVVVSHGQVATDRRIVTAVVCTRLVWNPFNGQTSSRSLDGLNMALAIVMDITDTQRAQSGGWKLGYMSSILGRQWVRWFTAETTWLPITSQVLLR